VRDGGLHDPRALGVAQGVCPLVAQGCTGLFGLGERDDFLEREPEQIAKPDQLLQARDGSGRCSAELGEHGDEKYRDEQQEEELRDDDSAADREDDENKQQQQQHFVPHVFLGFDADLDEPSC
jgi:hypothetical protein